LEKADWQCLFAETVALVDRTKRQALDWMAIAVGELKTKPRTSAHLSEDWPAAVDCCVSPWA
jgi:hypothetical protein